MECLWLYIGLQQRDGDPEVFWSHENQIHPPSIFENGKIRFTSKSDLLKCFDITEQKELPEIFDSKISDGGSLIPILPTTNASKFQDFAQNTFIPHLKYELQKVTMRIDIVWDQYWPNSIKSSTRQNRGTGVRTKVSPLTKMPKNMKNFILVSNNKTELFDYLNLVYKQWEKTYDTFSRWTWLGIGIWRIKTSLDKSTWGSKSMQGVRKMLLPVRMWM